MIPETENLSRKQIKAVFRRNRGASANLARELGIKQNSISDWMRNRGRSKRVHEAILSRAADLVAAERNCCNA